MKKATTLIATLAAATLASGSAAAITVDGVLDAGYGVARSIQTTQTNCGDNNLGQFGFANGSELDAAFVAYAATP